MVYMWRSDQVLMDNIHGFDEIFSLHQIGSFQDIAEPI